MGGNSVQIGIALQHLFPSRCHETLTSMLTYAETTEFTHGQQMI